MDRLAAQVRRLVRATEAYRRLVAEVLGLGVTEANALAELWYSGSLTPSVLAERLGLTSPSVTAVVDRLELTGLVARRRHPVDRRSVFVELTDSGLDELRVMVEMFGEDVLNGVRVAAPEHILELDRLLEQIATTLEARTAERAGIASSLARFTSGRESASQPTGGEGPLEVKQVLRTDGNLDLPAAQTPSVRPSEG